MPTNNPRINVTFEPKLNTQINSIAIKEHKSASRLIKELVIEALERREDVNLSAIAELREKQARQTISHEDAWT